MFVTHVQYTVKPEYAFHNRANVQAVMLAESEPSRGASSSKPSESGWFGVVG